MEAQGAKTCEEYQSMVKDKVAKAEWKCTDVNELWQQMKNIMMDTAQVTCGLSKGLCTHKETWRWNEEVAETVRENKKKYGNLKKRKIDRGMEGVQEEKTKRKKGYSVNKGKETEGICKRSK